jgi:hypothetical protein
MPGSDERNTGTLNVYPNPANERITVELPEVVTGGIMTLSNLSGQRMNEFDVSGDRIGADVSTLPVGIYVIELQVEGKTFTQKVVIERK